MNELNALGNSIAGSGQYAANAVNFDGSVYLSRGADLTGNADSNAISLSFWAKAPTSQDLERTIYTNKNQTFGITFSLNSLVISGSNSAGTQILNAVFSAVSDPDSWNHFMFSADLSDTGKRHAYVNGSAASITYNTYTNGLIDHTVADHTIGSLDGGLSKFTGDISDVWIDLANYIDLSNSSNRAKFISGASKPVDLGSSGERPTGSSPKIFLSGDTSTWHTNKGTGGGFTENGALVTASTSPSD